MSLFLALLFLGSCARSGDPIPTSAANDSADRNDSPADDPLITAKGQTIAFEQAVSSAVNDACLKTLSQPDGVKSYGRVVDLILADFVARNGCETVQ